MKYLHERVRRYVVALSVLSIAAGTVGVADAKCSRSKKSSAASTKTTAKNIVDTAVSAGSFGTLVTALKEAELVSTLQGEGPFTVFAPTDEAFKKIPKDQLDAILKDKAKLTKILTYHVVAGNVKAADVVKLTSANTVEGDPVAITASAAGVKINDANVTATDVLCSNGVIHVIDTVIIPPTK